jgi:hypothetical protein
MRDIVRTFLDVLASIQDASISLTFPGIYASLQSLATLLNPFGIIGGDCHTTAFVSIGKVLISNAGLMLLYHEDTGKMAFMSRIFVSLSSDTDQ